MNRRHRLHGDRGAAAIIIAICTVLLFGLVALVVDLGNAQDRKQATQNQADFAALAAVPGMSATASGTPIKPTTSPICPDGGSPDASDPTEGGWQAVCMAADYLIKNQPQSDKANAFPWGTDVSDLAARLVNSLPSGNPDMTDGQVCYGTFDTNGLCVAQAGQFTVVTPPAQVDFHFAEAMKSNWTLTDVQSMATVGAGTPGAGTGMMPYYGYSGCDYGLQTIAEPTNGQAAPPGINLAFPNDASSNAPVISDVSVSPAWPDTAGLAHNQIPAPPVSPAVYTYPPPYTITIAFSSGNASNVAHVGFFQSASSNPPPPVQVGPYPTDANGFTVGTVNGLQSLTLKVPSAVYNPTLPYTVGTWYVRVSVPNPSNGKNQPAEIWSPIVTGNGNNGGNLAAYPFFVGDATLITSCSQGSSSGNFGALQLCNYHLATSCVQGSNNPDTGNANAQNAQNLAYGLFGGADGEGAMVPYPTPLPPTCTAVTWPDPQTDCVGTGTGHSTTTLAMTAGLITGDGTVSGDGSAGLGRLVERGSPTPGFGEPTSDDCVGQVPGDSDGYVDVTLGKTTYSINNDTLSCFITNNTTKIKDFANGSYSGPPVLSPDIYCSPRFFWVPIVPTQPANGQSLTYPIQQFRPAFITYQNLKGDLEDTHLNGPDPDPNNPLNKNGLAAPPNNGGKLQSVSIIFFNANALPASAGTSKCTPEIGQWLGGDTPKVPLLKN